MLVTQPSMFPVQVDHQSAVGRGREEHAVAVAQVGGEQDAVGPGAGGQQLPHQVEGQRRLCLQHVGEEVRLHGQGEHGVLQPEGAQRPPDRLAGADGAELPGGPGLRNRLHNARGDAVRLGLQAVTHALPVGAGLDEEVDLAGGAVVGRPVLGDHPIGVALEIPLRSLLDRLLLQAQAVVEAEVEEGVEVEQLPRGGVGGHTLLPPALQRLWPV